MKKWMISLCTLFSFSLGLYGESEQEKKEKMIQDLEFIKYTYPIVYAPFEWKKELFSLSWEEAFTKAKQEVLLAPAITTKQFHQVVKRFLGSLKDYHVKVEFFSTEKAFLPFSVKQTQNRYFIDWIDPHRFPLSVYGPHIGDEILFFGDEPIQNVIQNLIENGQEQGLNAETNRSAAAQTLTLRLGAFGDVVPQGAVNLTTRSCFTGKISTIELLWEYFPEEYFDCGEFSESSISSHFEKETSFSEFFMEHPLQYAKNKIMKKAQKGSGESFVPPLGEIIWSTLDFEGFYHEDYEYPSSEKQENTWEGYIYLHQGHRIGYIRIPSYSRKDQEELGEILRYFEDETDALVIDQVNNGGGYITTMYDIVSMLIEEPIEILQYKVKLNHKLMSTIANCMENLLQTRSAFNESPEQFLLHNFFDHQANLRKYYYCQLIMSEWKAGRIMTNNIPLLGYGKLNPHPYYRYTKPVVVLVNELDFSCADFFPAILQDHHRAVIFGTPTAGAGGSVNQFNFYNHTGISKCSFTASIIERRNKDKIENVGVYPDVEYVLTPEDIQFGYQSYVQALNKIIFNLINNNK